jgi:beta-N-acetylhexosaminidase
MAGALMLDVAGLSLTDDDRELLKNPQVGGLILFSRNYESPAQLQQLIGEIRECNADILIAVDQEGGRVQRFKDGFTRLPPMAVLGDIYQSEPSKAAHYSWELGWLMAAELLSYGVDISFAPVLDLNFGVSEVIGDRAFDRDEGNVTRLAGAFIAGMREAGMASTGKHFPGHGWVVADSHHEIPVDERTLQQIEEQDLKQEMEAPEKLLITHNCSIFPDQLNKWRELHTITTDHCIPQLVLILHIDQFQ